MSKTTLASILLAAGILASWGWLYSKLRPEGIDLNPYQALGEAAAGETARLVQNSGRVVMVDADFGKYKILAPTTDAEIKSFKKAIRKTGLKVVGLEKVALARPSLARNGIFMEPGQLSGVMARHAGVDVIVLFVGLAGPDDLSAGAPEKRPRLVLVSNYEPYVKALLQKRVIQLAIAPRAGVDSEQDGTIHSRKEWFERHYQVLTPEPNADSGK
jgi:hypothetical protein